MISTHFVTGATGFVGAALVVELLQRTSDPVICLVRPHSENVTERLHRTIMHAAECYGMVHTLREAIVERCRAIAGDVEQPHCGISTLENLHCDQFWHSAASLRFEDRFATEIIQTNVQGTAHALDLAARLGTKHFNYMSTAYVCGSREGVILEAPTAADVSLNNQYERSKVAAELLVAKDDRFGRRIMRPSIVVGHSRTHEATNFTGMYGFLRKLHAFKGMMERTQAGLLSRKSIRLRLNTDATLNFVPIDRVVANAVTIAMRTCPARNEVEYYHLTNPTPPATDATVDTVVECVGLPSMTFVKDKNDFDWLDEKFNSRVDFYNSYFMGCKTFDRTRVERIVGDEALDSYDMRPERVGAYCRWYVNKLKEERLGLPETR